MHNIIYWRHRSLWQFIFWSGIIIWAHGYRQFEMNVKNKTISQRIVVLTLFILKNIRFGKKTNFSSSRRILFRKDIWALITVSQVFRIGF